MNAWGVLIFVLIFIAVSKSDEDFQSDEDYPIFAQETDDVNYTEDIDKALQTIESNAAAIERVTSEGMLPSEENERYYKEISETLTHLIEIINTPAHAYKFLKAEGVERVLIPNMDVEYPKLRRLVFNALRTLFEVVPLTVDKMVPATLIDKLLDIFEYDNNLGVKAYVLDILYIWLPENPRIQIRVMKLKGLEPFYRQVTKLDTSAISKLLDLFNKILKEHIKVRNDKRQRSKLDSDKIIMYQRIGLIERMSTPTVCNGLLSIFDTVFSYITDNNDVIVPVTEMIKIIKPYCTTVFKRKASATKLFEAMLTYLQDDSKREYFYKLGLNVTDAKLVMDNLVNELKKPRVKDEF